MTPEKLQLPDFLIAELYNNCIVELDDERRLNEQPGNTGKTVIAENQQKVATIKKHEKVAAVKIDPPLPDPSQTIKYLGQNNGRVAILLREESVPFILDSDLEFLTKILKACNLDLRDIAIINTYDKPISFEEIKEQLATEYTLLFDVDPSTIALPFTIPHFQVQGFGGSSFVCAPALNKMAGNSEQSRALKTQLWKALQKMFKLVK